ncbi:MAG: arsenite methyltransferase, partial [Candidatus Bathyarchaeota archaeon]|nr:arsenite methyltransferase [Candidatus Bathyarchaeota archaeon]
VTGTVAGCGNPTALAELKEGDVVLDLGSGGGIDAFLAAKKVGPKGRVIGVDMTEEMVQLAKDNAERMKVENVEFRLGEIENLPLEDEIFDVLISNCVINLSPDKDKVFGEAFRVLKPGGRVLISDIVTQGELPDEIRENPEMWAACIAGALDEKVYLQKIMNAGFEKVEVIAKNDFMGMVSSIKVRAYKRS